MLEFKEYFILGDILFLNELSVNPNYRTKAGSFPYYILDIPIVTTIKSKLGRPRDELKFKCVATKSKEKKEFDKIKKDKNVIEVGSGGFMFHVHTLKNKPFKYKGKEWYIQTTKGQVKAHFGVATRKDATASANINEYCTMYFLKNPERKTGLDKWMNDVIKGKKGKTGKTKEGRKGRITRGSGHSGLIKKSLKSFRKFQKPLNRIMKRLLNKSFALRK